MTTNGTHDFEISVVAHALDNKPTPQSFRRLLQDIQHGKWRDLISQVRLAYSEGGKDRASAPKKKLPGALFSGTFSHRSSDKLLHHSGLICVDLDELGDQLDGYRDLIFSDPHTLAAFISPTGTGLKVIFRCDPAKPHLESFRAAERYVLEHFGLEIDPACKDVNRLCFVSDDPEALVSADAEPLPYPPPPVEVAAPVPRSPALTGLTPGDDYDNRHNIPSLLLQHGWTKIGKTGWRRPGKNDGISATFDHVPNRFYVFSSSTAFQTEHVYNPWHVYAILEHNGDFRAAAKKLYEDNFGDRIKAQPKSDFEGLEFADEAPPQKPKLKPEREAELRASLKARAFDAAKKLEKPKPIYSIGGTVVCTPGNLTTIYSQAKTGKSSLVGAMLSAAFTNPTSGYDTLSVTGPNYAGHALMHFDTEQSPYDFQQLVFTSMRRVGLTEPPPWLLSYHLTGLDALACRQSIEIALKDARAQFGGIHSVTIDGVADLVIDPNDPAECFPLVTSLHAQAIEYSTAIICILHMNPGSEVKGRGHLGSQLERKSESNLTLTKEGDISSITSTKQRGKSIPKDKAPSFKWSDESQMHVSCGTPAAVSGAKRGRPEVYTFATYRGIFPTKSSPGQPISQLSKTLSTNLPIDAKRLYAVVQRWIEDGQVEAIDSPQGRRYRLAL